MVIEILLIMNKHNCIFFNILNKCANGPATPLTKSLSNQKSLSDIHNDSCKRACPCNMHYALWYSPCSIYFNYDK